MRLGADFYNQHNTLTLAPLLIGKLLVRETEQGRIAGMITEVEAYVVGDAANHSFTGKTERNKHMFLPAGHLYIYKIYGIHHCLNVVSSHPETGEAILIRAAEPLEGISEMRENYPTKNLPDAKILSGPGRLARAYNLDRSFSGLDLTNPESEVFLEEYSQIPDPDIITTPRIGVGSNKDAMYRFYLRDHPSVSRTFQH